MPNSSTTAGYKKNRGIILPGRKIVTEPIMQNVCYTRHNQFFNYKYSVMRLISGISIYVNNPFRLLVIFLLFYSAGVLAQTEKAATTSDLGWPRQIEQDGATLVYYQPQIDEWKDYKNITARMAFSLKPKNGKETLGVADLSGKTDVNKDNRTVYLHNVSVTAARFPALNETDAASMEKLFKKIVPKGGQPISLDRVLADMQQQNQNENSGVALNNAPPQIFYSTSPAILLMTFGDPVYAPVEKTSIKYVVNTNWDLFIDSITGQYYLLVNSTWLTSHELQSGWKPTNKLPTDMSKLPSGENFDDVKKQIPAKTASDVPEVFYSNEPAELIACKGKPVYSKITSTNLLYVTNTDNDLFLDNTTNEYYVLLSGRWFSAQDLQGPWTFAGDKLPADFKKIPSSSPKARVLASVPGTKEASDAVMLAQIPTTAVVNKAEAEAKAKVTYDGNAPQFKPIENTSLEYASNTQDKVIKDGDIYYLCFQGVWFMSTTPNGPWKVADSVDSKIYTIPPSSPVYNVTYVTQTNATPTTVESSTTAGYFGMFILGMAAGAAIAYGTGWYYPPYIYWRPMYPYPVYRPWPYTYGGGAVYNPWTGGFAAGRRVYGPYGAAGGAAWYNPATGRYGRAASAQGWYGGRTVASSYNPWTGGYGATSQAHNAYAQWGHSAAVRGNQWARSGHVTTAAGTVSGFQTSRGNEGIVRHGANGTVAHTTNGVYAGHDGNVYRKNSNGTWSQYSKNGGWNQVNTPATQNNIGGVTRNPNISGATRNQNISGQNRISIPEHTMQGLDRSSQARFRGQAQTQRFQNSRPAGGFRGRR